MPSRAPHNLSSPRYPPPNPSLPYTTGPDPRPEFHAMHCFAATCCAEPYRVSVLVTAVVRTDPCLEILAIPGIAAPCFTESLKSSPCFSSHRRADAGPNHVLPWFPCRTVPRQTRASPEFLALSCRAQNKPCDAKRPCRVPDQACACCTSPSLGVLAQPDLASQCRDLPIDTID